MATVTIELPSLLHRFAGGAANVRVEAETVRSALDQLSIAHPAMNVHLFDESGAIRQHVLCFHNGVNTRWRNQPDVRIQDGDTLTIMQAVSGG